MKPIALEAAQAHLRREAEAAFRRDRRTETCFLTEALGRVCARSVEALEDVPRHALAAMDGYAVRARDFESLPVCAAVQGESRPGSAPLVLTTPGQVVRILTGGPLPIGADTVLLQEHVLDKSDGSDASDISGGPRIEIPPTVEMRPGQHVRASGLDFSRGQTLVEAGTILTLRMLGMVATAGTTWLEVVRKPLVAVLASGSELRLPGSVGNVGRVESGGAQLPSSNSVTLMSGLPLYGASVWHAGVVSDELAELVEAIDQTSSQADLVVTTGGTSVGTYDRMLPALKQLGFTIFFNQIAVKPGKPVLFGRRGDRLVLALPGNPVSVTVGLLVFVLPFLLGRLGVRSGVGSAYADYASCFQGRPGRLCSGLPPSGPREEFLRARFDNGREDGELWAEPFSGQDSSQTFALTRAEGFILRPAHQAALAAGAPVRVLQFPPPFASY